MSDENNDSGKFVVLKLMDLCANDGIIIDLSASRSKRRKVNKNASAFERLRELKQSGSKNKWVNDEDSKVYDEVDEDEYTKIVSNRASDWIVDDGKYLLSYWMLLSMKCND